MDWEIWLALQWLTKFNFKKCHYATEECLFIHIFLELFVVRVRKNCLFFSFAIFTIKFSNSPIVPSKDHDDENITIQKEWHSKSVSKNGHTKRCGRSKVWQGGWGLLKVTIHSEKPDSIKLVSPPPDDLTSASPSFMSYTQFKFCV